MECILTPNTWKVKKITNYLNHDLSFYWIDTQTSRSEYVGSVYDTCNTLLWITLFSLLCTLLSALFCINVFYPKMGDQKRMIYSLISCQDLFFLSKLFSFLGDKFYNLRLSCKNLASQMSLPYQKNYPETIHTIYMYIVI